MLGYWFLRVLERLDGLQVALDEIRDAMKPVVVGPAKWGTTFEREPIAVEPSGWCPYPGCDIERSHRHEEPSGLAIDMPDSHKTLFLQSRYVCSACGQQHAAPYLNGPCKICRCPGRVICAR